MARLEIFETEPIVSGNAQGTSTSLTGNVIALRIDVLQSDGETGSTNTADVTVADFVFEDNVTAVTGISGLRNLYVPRLQGTDDTGSAITGDYVSFPIASDRLTITVANGTDGEIVRVYAKVL